MTDATDGDADEELAATVDELADVLRELRGELRPRRRGPFGLPAPPSPGELLRFTDEHAIPFTIAVLEANIRALELLQGAIRLAGSGAEAGEEARRAGDRAASLGRSTLRRLDDVLSDLEEAASEGALPRQAAARDVLEEARRLRAEVDEALAARVDDGGSSADAPASVDDATVIEVDEPTSADGEDRPDGRDPPEVDVEGELRSIKEELGKLDERTGDGDGATDEEPGEETPADTEDGTNDRDADDAEDGTNDRDADDADGR